MPSRSLHPLSRTCSSVALAVAVCLSVVPGEVGAQSFELNGLRGERLTDADLSQGATLVIVWTSWSPRSRNIVARVNTMAEHFGRKAKIVTVNFQEVRSVVEKFLADKPLAVPVFLDPDGVFSKTHSVTTLPGLLILKEGRVVYRGKLPEDPDRIILEALG